MKKILSLSVAALLLCSCYEPYVKDYDYSGVYVAYQYDLRSLVVGEGMTFDFGSVLGGVISNNQDRTVNFVVDDELITGDLSKYGGTTAIEGLKNSPSQPYVASAITSAGLFDVSPLPKELYRLSNSSSMVIASGRHTATVNFKADSLALISDPHISEKPYYAFGWRITSADADKVINEKCFGIIAIRLENMFFGSWYHGGKSRKISNADGQLIAGSEKSYPAVIPSAATTHEVYTLSSSGAFSCESNFKHLDAGKMTINMDGKKVSVSGNGITDMGSDWNHNILMQNRKIFLNYKYDNGDGTSTVVTDTLIFRNRVRDGVNEWQDPNPEHYK